MIKKFVQFYVLKIIAEKFHENIFSEIITYVLVFESLII